MRAIDGDALRKKLLEELHKRSMQGFGKGLMIANSCVVNAPTIEPEPHWIPCSERLPEDGQDVLFCDIDEDIMLGYHVKGRPNTHFTQCGSWDEIKNVFAWMSLPEPWRGEDHGQSRE